MKTFIRHLSSAAVVLVACGTSVAATEANALKLDTGIVFARGTYGLETNTDVFIALLNPSYETASWRVEGSIPYVRLEGPATVVGNTGSTKTTESSSGLGDVTLALSRKFSPGESGWGSSVGVKVKLPTADDGKGIGTGELDTTVQIDLFKTGGAVTPFATVGYQFLGESDAYPMKSGPFATAGLSSKIGATTVGGALTWRAASIEGTDDSQEAMAFAQWNLAETSRLQVFALRGFTDSSPDLAVGVMVGFNF